MTIAFQEGGASAPPNQRKLPLPSYSRRFVPACPDAGRAPAGARSLRLPSLVASDSFSNRQTHEKLKNQLTPTASATSKFLIDNFCRLSRRFLVQLFVGRGFNRDVKDTARVSSFCASYPRKVVAFPLPASHFPLAASTIKRATRKLENQLTRAASNTSKFLIDNFCGIFAQAYQIIAFACSSLACPERSRRVTCHSSLS